MKLLALDPCGIVCAAAVYAVDPAGAVAPCGTGAVPGGPSTAAGAAGAASAAALKAAGVRWSDIERLVVARGPGGFTALRAGLAFALGVGAAIGRPVVGVSRFAALQAAHRQAAAILPADRGALFARRADGVDRVGSAAEIVAWLDDPWAPLCGPGATALAMAGGGVVVHVVPPALVDLARIGVARPADHGLRPLYLRPPAVTPAAADASAGLRDR